MCVCVFVCVCVCVYVSVCVLVLSDNAGWYGIFHPSIQYQGNALVYWYFTVLNLYSAQPYTMMVELQFNVWFFTCIIHALIFMYLLCM